VLPSGGRVLPPALDDVVAGLGGGASVCPDRVVLLALELGWAVEHGGIVRTIVCHWGWWVVVTRWLVIGPFELKFDRLNWKLAVFYHYGSKKSKKILNFLNFVPRYPINTSYGLSLFHIPSIKLSLSSSHIHNVFIQLKQNRGSTYHDVLGRHGRSYEHVTSRRGRSCHRFFVNMRAKALLMICQPWLWSGSF
jgi:hypothetical protein